ncbi:hypothetical protein [Ideonella sp.]|uniref:hypothetical protein n=1 Tax=Ideonella sp. TaxID=1929293 RepID=UPI002B4A451E|nr:hypothetical protein [Ideonella sp.]HJV70590.1 hypothetical protein [Ideonella sp.]
MLSRRLRVGLMAGLLLAVGVGAAVVAAEVDRAKRRDALTPAVEPARRGAQCIADTEFMRRHHMELLSHQRDKTVHLGVRGADASLQGCISCHASTRTGSVAKAPADFCVACHAYAAVRIDCFDCHASTPTPTAVATGPEAPR